MWYVTQLCAFQSYVTVLNDKHLIVGDKNVAVRAGDTLRYYRWQQHGLDHSHISWTLYGSLQCVTQCLPTQSFTPCPSAEPSKRASTPEEELVVTFETYHSSWLSVVLAGMATSSQLFWHLEAPFESKRTVAVLFWRLFWFDKILLFWRLFWFDKILPMVIWVVWLPGKAMVQLISQPVCMGRQGMVPNCDEHPEKLTVAQAAISTSTSNVPSEVCSLLNWHRTVEISAFITLATLVWD